MNDHAPLKRVGGLFGLPTVDDPCLVLNGTALAMEILATQSPYVEKSRVGTHAAGAHRWLALRPAPQFVCTSIGHDPSFLYLAICADKHSMGTKEAVRSGLLIPESLLLFPITGACVGRGKYYTYSSSSLFDSASHGQAPFKQKVVEALIFLGPF